MLKLGRYPHQKIQSSHLKIEVWPFYAEHGGFRLAVSHWPSAYIWILGSQVVESSVYICFHSLLTSSLAEKSSSKLHFDENKFEDKETKVFKKVAYPIKREIVIFYGAKIPAENHFPLERALTSNRKSDGKALVT